MKRSGFKRKPFPAHEPRAEREPKPLARATRTASYGGTVTGNPVSKDAPVRSEAYRRLVAALPCACCCAPGPSQAAHSNFGKGLSLKSDDRTCFPLCPTCHRDHDQGGRLSREERRFAESVWGTMTRALIEAAGQWPANLPLWTKE